MEKIWIKRINKITAYDKCILIIILCIRVWILINHVFYAWTQFLRIRILNINRLTTDGNGRRVFVWEGVSWVHIIKIWEFEWMSVFFDLFQTLWMQGLELWKHSMYLHATVGGPHFDTVHQRPSKCFDFELNEWMAEWTVNFP